MAEPIDSYELHSDGTFLVNGEEFPHLIAGEVIVTPDGVTVTMLRKHHAPELVEEALVDARARLKARAGRA